MRRKLDGTRRPDGTWRIVLALTDESGAKHRKYIEAKTQRECQRKAREFLRRHEDRKPRPGMSVEAFLERAIEERFVPRCDPDTVADYRKLASAWIVPRVGRLSLESLTVAHVEAVMTAAAEEGKTRTANLIRAFLRAALNWGLKLGIVQRNVAALADPVQHSRAERAMLTRSDLARILAAEPSRVRRTLWTFLAETGLRPSEALGLTWAQLHDVDGEWYLKLAQSKTVEGKRPVPIDRDLVAMLQEIRQGDWCFPSESGRPLGYRNCVRDWHRAIERANAGSSDPIPDTNLYQLRKLFGREMARVTPDHVLKRLMRHTHIQTTKQFYLDAEMTEMREALKRKRSGG